MKDSVRRVRLSDTDDVVHALNRALAGLEAARIDDSYSVTCDGRRQGEFANLDGLLGTVIEAITGQKLHVGLGRISRTPYTLISESVVVELVHDRSVGRNRWWTFRARSTNCNDPQIVDPYAPAPTIEDLYRDIVAEQGRTVSVQANGDKRALADHLSVLSELWMQLAGRAFDTSPNVVPEWAHTAAYEAAQGYQARLDQARQDLAQSSACDLCGATGTDGLRMAYQDLGNGAWAVRCHGGCA